MAASDFEQLVADARGGDHNARAVLLHRFLPEIHALVRLRAGAALRQQESCSDLAQSVCRQVLLDLHGFRGGSEASFQSWLHAVAQSKILDRVKYHQAARRNPGTPEARAPVADDEPARLLQCYATFCTPSRQAIAAEEIARIETAFDQLPPEHQEVVTLACLLGLPHRAVAERMGRTEVAVRKLLSRARARLAMLLPDS